MSRISNANFNSNVNAIGESPVLCIPRVFLNISEQRIIKIFADLCLGVISRIDMIERKSATGESFKRVFIHFERWFDNQNAQSVRRKLMEGKEIKIVYDEPWFWKVSASKWTPQVQHARPNQQQQRTKPHIVMSDSPPRQRDGRDGRDGRDVDEFGRSNQLRRENESYTRERQYAAHRQFEERQRHNNIPIAPTLSAPRFSQREQYDDRQRQPRQPRQPRQQFIPRTPSCSPPRVRPTPVEVVAPVLTPEPAQSVVIVEAQEEQEETQDERRYQDPDDEEEYNIVLNYDEVLKAPLPRKRTIVKNAKKPKTTVTA